MQRPACTFKRYFFSFIFIVFFIVFLIFCFFFVFVLFRTLAMSRDIYWFVILKRDRWHLLIRHTKKEPLNIYWSIIPKRHRLTFIDSSYQKAPLTWLMSICFFIFYSLVFGQGPGDEPNNTLLIRHTKKAPLTWPMLHDSFFSPLAI